MKKEIMLCDRCKEIIESISSGYYEEVEERIDEIERMEISYKEFNRDQRKLNSGHFDLCSKCSKEFNEFMSAKMKKVKLVVEEDI